MNNKRRHHSNFAFKMITFMHDNPLLPIIRNPYKILERAGLKSGQTVLEVGCGPGFFTIPAAKIVGKAGKVYAVDIHPLAIERVQNKIDKAEIKNVSLIHGNASDTGLPDQSIDLAFMFGLPYIQGGLDSLLTEMYRIFKPGAILAFQKSRGSKEKLIKEVQEKRFKYLDQKGRIFIFEKGN
ncbi:class I SAM-dependent methyltransferase [candidate division KSB1 bacterium]|nr:class I SAM-dependent methyltransferase [candidate division KSB1 bacterium]